MKLTVTSIPERFRRAGMNFTRQPTAIDVDDATAAILKGEPMLVVTDGRAADGPQTQAGKEKKQGGTQR